MDATFTTKFTEGFPILGLFHKDGHKEDINTGKSIAIEVTNIIEMYEDNFCSDSLSKKYRKRTYIRNNRERYYVQETVEECLEIIKNTWKESIDIINKLKINKSSIDGEQL